MELLPSALEGQDSNETQLDAVSHTSYVHDQIGFNNCSFSWEPFDAQPQKGRRNFKLTFGATQTGLEGYVDADGMSHADRKAILGYVFLIDGGAISWSSKKQPIVSLSSTEAEYVAATHAAKEALWYRQFFKEVSCPLSKPVSIYGDNQGAIALTIDDRYHARTKHIDICYHFIREAVARRWIRISYLRTDDMPADLLTKALAPSKVAYLRGKLGLC